MALSSVQDESNPPAATLFLNDYVLESPIR